MYRQDFFKNQVLAPHLTQVTPRKLTAGHMSGLSLQKKADLQRQQHEKQMHVQEMHLQRQRQHKMGNKYWR